MTVPIPNAHGPDGRWPKARWTLSTRWLAPATTLLMTIYLVEAITASSQLRFNAARLPLLVLDGFALGLAVLIAFRSGTIWSAAVTAAQLVTIACLLFRDPQAPLTFAAWGAAHIPAAIALLPGLVTGIDRWRRGASPWQGLRRRASPPVALDQDQQDR